VSLLEPLEELPAEPLESAVPSLLASEVAALLDAVSVAVTPLDELSAVADPVPGPLDSAVVVVVEPVAVSVVVVALPEPVDVSSPPQPSPVEPTRTIVIMSALRMVNLRRRG
jgi:hypothetical protein